jgi:hypothetical protein
MNISKIVRFVHTKKCSTGSTEALNVRDLLLTIQCNHWMINLVKMFPENRTDQSS